MFSSCNPNLLPLRFLIGLGASLFATNAIAGDHLFHKKKLAATPVQQAVVTVPVQVSYAPAVQIVPLSPTYVAVAQAPVNYTVSMPQAAPAPAQAPVLNIKL